MSKTVTTLDQHSSVALPPEALDALGIEAGAELEVALPQKSEIAVGT